MNTVANRRIWLSKELETVKEMAAKGYSDREIGIKLRRSRSSVWQARVRYGIKCGHPNKSNDMRAVCQRNTASEPAAPSC